ncbi:MAG TPA: efflux RND transporter periplasmic adaptor subunit [Stellaceae bacterium]|nr:efflux RND transporter periplasmic adaptor subunit [Stellaceae bacterium]
MTAFRLFIVGVFTAGIAASAIAQQASPPPLYYRDPSGEPFYSAIPKKDAQGRDYLPVYTDSGIVRSPAMDAASSASQPADGKGKIVYYRNPMGLPDTSPVPKQDAMGMAYVPVYEGDVADAGIVKISPGRVQQLGVRTEAAAEHTMSRTIRAVGTVALDERRISVVAPRFEGWIEKLLVNTTGQPVRKGEPLAEIYGPDLLLAEQEYLVARDAAGHVEMGDSTVYGNSNAIAEAVLTRLRNWGISAEQVARLTGKGGVKRTLALTAPMNGVVMEKLAVEGLHFAPGDTLYRIADLSTVWVLADVFEQDLGLIQAGQEAKVTVPAYPDRAFSGNVAFIYPSINRETRTAKVRIELPNPDLVLKTDMYASAEIAAPVTSSVVAVPDSAVLDSGTRQVVLIERGQGRFEPRPVKLGQKAGGYVEIREGVAAGEKVVVGANFLIDAESNLRAALQAFTAARSQETQP